MANFWDRAKGWIAGIVGTIGAALSVIPMPLPAKIIATSVCAGIPLIIGIVELIRAAVRRHKGKKPVTITEAALASDVDVDAGEYDATSAYKKATKRRGKKYFEEWKKDKKSKKNKAKSKKASKYNSKKKGKKKDKKSKAKAMSLYDVACDIISTTAC